MAHMAGPTLDFVAKVPGAGLGTGALAWVVAIPGFSSLVSLESITNCWTFPCGTPLTGSRSGAGTYFGPITKLS